MNLKEMKTTLLTCYLLSFLASVLQVLYVPVLAIIVVRSGYTTLDVGLVTGIASFVYVLGASTASLTTRKVSEGITVTASLVMALASLVILYYSHSLALITAASCLALYSFSIFWPSVESILSVNEGSVSHFSFSWSSGTLVGSVFATTVLLVPPELILTAFAFITTIMMALSTSLLRLKISVVENVNPGDILRGVWELSHSWKLSFAYAASLGGVLSFYPVIVGEKHMFAWDVSILFFSIILSRTLTFYFFDKIKHIGVGVTHSVLLLSTLLPLPFVESPPLVLLLGLLAGVGQGILYASSLETAFSTAESMRTIYTGLFEASIGLGYTLGPMVAGIFSIIGIEYTIIASTLLAVIVALIPVRGRTNSYKDK